MSGYTISRVWPSDKKELTRVEALLRKEGIRLDQNLDYTCAMHNEEGSVIATGSCFGNTLRCLAVSSAYRGEALMNEIISHLIQVQFERGNIHLFLYAKCSSAKFFRSLGFYEIVCIEDEIVFMENDRRGFARYLDALSLECAAAASALPGPPRHEKTAAIIMNANPFTLGHRFLVEQAASENDLVHLFCVSEDASLIPAAVRKRLIREGTADLPNVFLHDSGPYMISNATFPSYFQKDEVSVIRSHALLDLTIFTRIAKACGIGRRYAGEEPKSLVTGIYNEIMQTQLPENGLSCVILPRLEKDGAAISASTVRKLLQKGEMSALRELIPASSYDYFVSDEAAPVIAAIRQAEDVAHY